jgi:hypothetical protein
MSLCDFLQNIFPGNRSGGFVSNLFGFGDDVPFEVRLAETIAWCQPRVRREDIRNSLRSSELQPELLNANRSYTVQQIVRHRGVLRPLPTVTTQSQLAVGKLLVYFPDEQVCDGASEAATKGFFDVYDAPPWDTWIGLFNDTRGTHLVSWVPPELIDLVEDGIYVNPVACIDWLSNVDLNLSRKLRDRGLID